MGIGAMRRLSAVRWGVAGKIVWAWFMTIPCAAIISAIIYSGILGSTIGFYGVMRATKSGVRVVDGDGDVIDVRFLIL